MNSKLNFILLIIFAFLITALMSHTGSIALLAVPFLFYIGAGLFLSPRHVSLSGSRELNSFRCKQGEPVTMKLAIRNSGDTIPCLFFSDTEFSTETIDEGSTTHSMLLAGDQTAEFQYTFRASRGRYTWEGLKLNASDPFGLFPKEITLSAHATLLVLPDPVNIRRFSIYPGKTLRAPGPNLSRLPGHGTNFWGVREYHQGDSLRQINWRLTARHPQQFFSKEFEREEMADIGFLLDARAVTNYQIASESLFEYSVSATSALAQYLLKVGNRVSLLAFGDHLLRTFPGFGKRQLVKILDQLAACRPAEKDTIDTLRHIPTRLFPSESLIILISPLCLRDLDTIRRFRAEGYQVKVISPNPFSLFKQHIAKSEFNSFAMRTAQIERELLIGNIRQLGVELIDWHVDQSLENSTAERYKR
jgi:uncharacterized protein (DUF58 family)